MMGWAHNLNGDARNVYRLFVGIFFKTDHVEDLRGGSSGAVNYSLG